MLIKYLTLALAVYTITMTSACSTSQETSSASTNISETANTPTQVTYYSGTIDQIQVTYHNYEDSVTVTMPDGMKFDLPRAMAASGIRYTKDDMTVFWSKGPTAQFWLDGKLIFSGEEK